MCWWQLPHPQGPAAAAHGTAAAGEVVLQPAAGDGLVDEGAACVFVVHGFADAVCGIISVYY